MDLAASLFVNCGPGQLGMCGLVLDVQLFVCCSQLGRLMAVSWGETSMTKERWYQMKAMERARLNRLNVTRPASSQNVEKVVAAYCG